MKQTAVEWLFDQINDALIDFTEGKISASIYGIRVTEYKYKAKEMHKQEIENAYEEGYNRVAKLIEDATKRNLNNETFGNNNEQQ
jgi:hypothetical protein